MIPVGTRVIVHWEYSEYENNIEPVYYGSDTFHGVVIEFDDSNAEDRRLKNNGDCLKVKIDEKGKMPNDICYPLEKDIEMENEEKMENEFWKIVDSIGWKELSKSENRIKESKEKAKELYGDKDKVWVIKVFNEIRRWEELLDGVLRPFWLDKKWKEFISDDSYWDLRAHIVGCGEEAVKKALAEPETVFEDYIKNDDYKENFEYWTHVIGVEWPKQDTASAQSALTPSQKEDKDLDLIGTNALRGWIRCTDENYPDNPHETLVAYWNGENWQYWIYEYCPYGWNVLCRSEAYWRSESAPIRK